MNRVACILAIAAMLLGAACTAAVPASASEHEEEEDPDENRDNSGPGSQDDEDEDDERDDRREDDKDDREDRREDDDDDEDDDDEDEDDDFDDDEDGFRVRESGVRFSTRDPGFTVQRTDRPLTHRFVELIEFVDHDADARYDAGETVLVRHDLQRSPDSVTNTTTTRTITYALDAGTLSLVVRGAGDATKFDVLVRNHTYERPDSLLALVSRLAIEGGVQVLEVDDQPAVAGAGSGDVPYLSWVTHVDTDRGAGNVSWSVLASLSDDESAALVYWAYPHATDITHDPVLGVIHIDVPRLLDGAVFGASLIAGLGLVAAGFVARRRIA